MFVDDQLYFEFHSGIVNLKASLLEYDYSKIKD
jgi:hypothetical protein